MISTFTWSALKEVSSQRRRVQERCGETPVTGAGGGAGRGAGGALCSLLGNLHPAVRRRRCGELCTMIPQIAHLSRFLRTNRLYSAAFTAAQKARTGRSCSPGACRWVHHTHHLWIFGCPTFFCLVFVTKQIALDSPKLFVTFNIAQSQPLKAVKPLFSCPNCPSIVNCGEVQVMKKKPENVGLTPKSGSLAHWLSCRRRGFT